MKDNGSTVAIIIWIIGFLFTLGAIVAIVPQMQTLTGSTIDYYGNLVCYLAYCSWI